MSVKYFCVLSTFFTIPVFGAEASFTPNEQIAVVQLRSTIEGSCNEQMKSMKVSNIPADAPAISKWLNRPLKISPSNSA